MSTKRLRTPRIKVNRVVQHKTSRPTRKNKVSPLDKYTWESYYAERSYYYGDGNETGTDK